MPYQAERAEAESGRGTAWRDALAGEGLLAAGARGPARPSSPRRCYAFLARTPALLLGVSLADAVGDRRPQNMPGHHDRVPELARPAV